MEDGLRFDEQESRAPWAPNLGKPAPEETVRKPELRPWRSALGDGQLLSEGEVLQSQILTEFEGGSEDREEGK